jgi:hypothetical protein
VTYFNIPPDETAFDRGDEPRAVLNWLEQRGRLGELRAAFEWLGFHDLTAIIDGP